LLGANYRPTDNHPVPYRCISISDISISLFDGGISMKLATNIHHVSGMN